MSDNDLISHEKLLHTLEGWLKLNARVVPTEIGKAVYMMIEDYPAVPQEMSAREYLQIHDRFVEWCTNQPCSRCDYRHGSCLMSLAITPEQRVADMQKWAREHPEEGSEE